MTLGFLLYFSAVALSVIVFILYSNSTALILLSTLVLLPIVLLLIHLTAFLLTKIGFELQENNVGVGNPLKLKIKIKNRSPFAVSSVKINAKIVNMFFNTENDCTFSVNAPPFCEKEFSYDITSDYIGNLSLQIEKVKFYDYLSLFVFSKKSNYRKIVSIYPNTVNASVKIRSNDWFSGEAQQFSSTVSGDDPSEVFNIREYKSGDKLNRVHWKLTSKTEKYMVKEFSLPLSDNVFVYLDLKISDTDKFDYVNSLLNSLVSLSECFLNQGITHHIGWYNSRKENYNSVRVSDNSELYSAISKIFTAGVFYFDEKEDRCRFFENSIYSHIVFMSTNTVKDVEKKFSLYDIDRSLKSMVLITDEDSTEVPTWSNVEYIPVVMRFEDRDLTDITL